MVEPYKPLYTVKEASEILKLNVSVVYKLIKDREIPALIIGERSQKKIRGSDLERFIEGLPPVNMKGGRQAK